MQLVQPFYFQNTFYRQYVHVRTWAMLLFLLTLDVLWELHALFSEEVYTPLVVLIDHNS